MKAKKTNEVRLVAQDSARNKYEDSYLGVEV